MKSLKEEVLQAEEKEEADDEKKCSTLNAEGTDAQVTFLYKSNVLVTISLKQTTLTLSFHRWPLGTNYDKC